MHDQIDKLKNIYKYQKEMKKIKSFLKIHILEYDYIVQLSLIEFCAYFGSANIFFFIISNPNYDITKKCLRYSLIGRN